jgi:hypothetical protein
LERTEHSAPYRKSEVEHLIGFFTGHISNLWLPLTRQVMNAEAGFKSASAFMPVFWEIKQSLNLPIPSANRFQ